MASKLHELLAVRDPLRGQAEKLRGELMNTFVKKQHHFTERRVTFKPSAEGAENKVEEQLTIQATVRDELAWITEKLANAMDVSFQIEKANTQASGDVVLDDGKTLLSGVPSTALLELEKRVAEVHELVNAIPTLDPAKGFQVDPDRPNGHYKARDVEKPRTEKSWDYKVMVPATDKHPAQVKELSIDRVVGHTVTQEWAGMLTVADKARMLDRVEEVARAVKKARARANEVEVNQDQKIGRSMLEYIFG